MVFRKSFAVVSICLLLGGCSTNEATGRQQFTGLMNTASETRMGATEQQKVQQQFGVVEDTAIQNYVDRICDKISPSP
jgi:predicted Zn-dependent protease